MRLIWLLVVGGVLILTQFTPVIGDELPEKVRKDWAERERKAERVEIKWKRTQIYSQEYLDLYRRPGDPPQEPKPQLGSYELLLDGEKYSFKHTGWVAEDKGGKHLSVSREVSDGKQSFNNNVVPERLHFSVHPHPQPRSMAEEFVRAGVGFEPIAFATRPSLALIYLRGAAKLTVAEETLPGRPEKLLKITQSPADPKRPRRILWIDPATSNVVQIDSRNDEIVGYQLWIEYGRPEATWVPRSWTLHYDIRPSGPLIKCDGQVESVAFPAEVPAEKFALKLNPGTIVFEGDDAYRIDTDGKKVKVEPPDDDE